MIYLNGQPVESPADADLGEAFQNVLTMIPQGADWMLQAISNQTMPPLYVSSGPQLLRLIQSGLHGDEMIRFISFRAHIDKILSMSPADVAQLAIVYQKPALDTEENLSAIFERNGITGYSSMAQVSAWLAGEPALNISQLNTPSFSGLLLLNQFMQQVKASPAGLHEQAVFFAEQRAANVSEFIDTYWFFVHVNSNNGEPELAHAIQNSNAQAIYNQLQPISFRLLFTLAAGPGKTAAELETLIPQLAQNNAFIGYETTAAGIRNLAGSISTANQQEPKLEAAAANYLSVIKNLIATAGPEPGRLSQDGKLISFRYENNAAVADVGYNTAGYIFLLPGTMLKPAGAA